MLVATYVVFAIVSGVHAPTWAYSAVAAFAIVVGAIEVATRRLAESRLTNLLPLRTAARIAALSAAIFAFAIVFIEWRIGIVTVLASALVTVLAALYAVARAPAEDGMVSRAATRRHYAPAWALVVLSFGAALAMHLAPLPDTLDRTTVVALAENFAASAGLGASGMLDAVALLELVRRRAELGARERFRSLALIGISLFAVAVVVAALRLTRPMYVFLVSSVVISLFAIHASIARHPDTLGRGALTFATFSTVGVLPTVLLAYLAQRRPPLAPVAVAAAALLAGTAARLAPYLREKIFPESEPWLEAFAIARRAATQTDPDAALAQALAELRALSHERLEAPCVFTLDPEAITTVDRAGYVRTESTTIPANLANLALEETDSVLTTDALEAVGVRRPETRGALTWMQDRKLRALALALEGDAPVGFVGVPSGDRAGPLALSEVRALAELTRLLGGQLGTSAKIARSVHREATHRQKEEALAKELEGARKELGEAHDHAEAFVRTLARRAKIATYSPAMRLLEAALEKFAESNKPLTLLDALGCDPLPYVALYHLASPRSALPLVVLDGRAPELRDLGRWRDQTASPIVAAKGGTILVRDPQELPKLVQAYLARAAPGSATLAVVVPRSIDVLAAEDALDEGLADLLGDAAVAVPRLASRSEDLRALAVDHLTRIGLRERKKPLGIDAGALEWLLEHDWPGNDAELESVLIRAALAMSPTADILTRPDLVRSGFSRTPASRAS